jgi:predicted nucleic acid-binding protein
MAQRLELRSAYDAAYVVLAEELDTKLWTLDGRLARNASSRGLPVQLIQTD